jgi:hypothetical protein
MKKLLKILGYGIGGIIVIILLVLGWVQFSGLPTFEHQSIAVKIPTDSLSLSVGRKIAEERCMHCHLGDDGKLSGRQFTPSDSPFGVIWSKNITQHKEHGIGNYTDGELAFLMRTGINKDGRFLGPFMILPTLSDEDLGSVVAYLHSNSPFVQPSAIEHPLPQYSLLAKAFIKLGMMSPMKYAGTPVRTPNSSDTLGYGKYLANGRYACFSCHSASFETNNDAEPEKSEGFFGGGNEIEDHAFIITRSANITMSKTHGIGNWTKEQFIHTLRTGERPDGKGLSAAMPRLPLSDDNELEAMWKYLQTVPVLEHRVERKQ